MKTWELCPGHEYRHPTVGTVRYTQLIPHATAMRWQFEQRGDFERRDQVFVEALEAVPSEVLSWYSVARGEMPEGDETVLGFNENWEPPVRPCYYDTQAGKECWWSEEGGALDDPENEELRDAFPPTHWTKYPTGPQL